LNVAVIQAAVRSPSGKKVRRVLSVNEILGYDPTTESFSFIEAFRWNPVTDGFDFPGNMNSFLMEEVIAMKRGIPPHKRKSVYSDLKKRARIFERIHKDRGVRDFDSFFQILAEAHTQGLL
ncbi:MAG: secretion system protein E, partial [Chloroflexi bacterium]|nr:secretion system protein E [Chloroflexota bacterium]